MSEILDLNENELPKTPSPNAEECFRCFMYILGLLLFLFIGFILITFAHLLLFALFPLIIATLAIVFILIITISIIGFQKGLKSSRLKESKQGKNTIGLIGNGCMAFISVLFLIVFIIGILT